MQDEAYSGGPWTTFWDMHSGGGTKEPPYDKIYIEAPEAEAKVIFYNRFGHNPERVTCTCCGDDYSIDEDATLAAATGFHRNCNNLATPRDPETGLYAQPDDPWWEEHLWIDPEDEAEALARGWEIEENTSRRIGREHGTDYGAYLTVAEYVQRPDVLVIPASEIKPEERSGDVPEQGYVWAG